MDRLQAMQIFTRVAEAGSFVRAAETLSLPSSTVTSTIKNLEKYLQVRLLNRTTRRVSLTPEGVQYLAQCRDILSLIEHAESSLTDSVRRPQGRLRVDMPAGIAHFIVMPNLQDFYRRYPDIYLMTGVSDRQVDLVQEGVDCVIRTGELTIPRWLRVRWAGFVGSPVPLRTISGSMVCHSHQTSYPGIGRSTIFRVKPGVQTNCVSSRVLRCGMSLLTARRPLTKRGSISKCALRVTGWRSLLRML